jgi:hypothetical protein
MTDNFKPGTPPVDAGYEHQDLSPTGIVYFLLALAVITVLCLFALRGLFAFLDHHERAGQPAVNPLLTDVPKDTRNIAPGYPQTAFPDPRLEEDERGQLNGIRMDQTKTLYSYGWVDEHTGTVHIPIERAMDLLAQKGLPVRAQGARTEDSGVDESKADSGEVAAPKTTGVNPGKKK